MTANTKKLGLKRETLRELSQAEAMNVQGGYFGGLFKILGWDSSISGGSCGAGTCNAATCGGGGTCGAACN